jgi:cobalt-zinc-cadmium efflux system outer membrane protein
MVLLISVSGYSQSVETFVKMAKSYNPGLKSLKLEYEAAIFKADQVNDWPDPKVSLGLGVLPVETRLGAQRVKIGVSQMIPWKGLLDAQSRAVRSKAEVISHFDEVKEIDIEYMIRTAYSTLDFLKARKVIIQQRLEVLAILGELAKSGVRSGKGKLSNVLFTERKNELLLADLELLKKKMEQPTIIINRWAGRELSAEIQISKDDELIDRAEVLKFAETEHPKYNILDSKINASNSVIDLTKYQSKPKIGVGLDYAYIDARSDVNIPGNGRDVLMPMGSITIPLNTGRYGAIRQEEAVKQESIKAQREELRDSYNAEIEMAYTTIEYNNQVVDKYEALKVITRETLKLMRVEYASEGTRFEELLRLEMELIDYDFEILKAGYGRDLAMATLYKFN